ncbi:MAG: YdcF family protein [Clostridia bacterium]|nr:YdcF family protein [Clostridia bacterium]
MKRKQSIPIWLMMIAALMSVPGCSTGTVPAEAPSATLVQSTPEPEPVEIRVYSSPTPEMTVPADELIYSMAVRYARGGEEEKTLRGEDLRLLREIDPLAADQWESILAFYDAARESETHYGVLPDGLDGTDALCIVIMGYQLNKNGSMKPELTERLEVALNCAEKYPHALLLCCGGGTAENNSKVTEADRMTDWLVGKGVDPGRIITENRSMSTAENAKYICRELKNYPQVREIAIVSSDYHILRASVLVQARSILELRSSDDEPLRIVSNAACRTNKKDVSDAKIVRSILQLTDDPELKALIRDEDFSSGSK